MNLFVNLSINLTVMDPIVQTFVIASALFVIILFIIAASINVVGQDKNKKDFSGMPKHKNIKGAA